jgi:hypothetical protein
MQTFLTISLHKMFLIYRFVHCFTSKTIKEMEKQNGNGRTKEVNIELNRMFEGLPIVDAKNDLRIVIAQSDISKGKPKDFEACVFAQACKRVFSSKKVLLMRSIAYISLPDEHGDYRVERFWISPAGQKVIADFDRGIMPAPGTSFAFTAPSPGRTLEGQRKCERKRKAKQRAALLMGDITGNESSEAAETPKRAGKSKQKITARPILDIRNGTGLISMRRK